MSKQNDKSNFITGLINNSISPKQVNKYTNTRKIHHVSSKRNKNKSNYNNKKLRNSKQTNNKDKGSKTKKYSRTKKPTKSKKSSTIENKYGILPMSCTLDIGTIGKLDSIKQVLGLHNRDAVVDLLLKQRLSSIIKTGGEKEAYELYYKTFMMKHKKSAEKHYKQFYRNGKKE